MSLAYAVQRLYDTGWSPASDRLQQRLEDGRAFPASADIRREFAEAGLTLTVRHVSLFNCYRAEWIATDSANAGELPMGYCVGATECEALVFALAQLMQSRAELAV